MAAMALSENMLKYKWDLRLQPACRVGKPEIADCFKDMCVVLQANNKFELTALRRKFAKSKHYQVAKLKIGLGESS